MSLLQSWPPEENRRDQRVSVLLRGELSHDSVASAVLVIDIAEGGVAFISDEHPPAGEFELRLALNDAWQEPAEAIAVNVESVGPGEFLVRARFAEPSPIASLLRQEMQEATRRRIEKRLFDG